MGSVVWLGLVSVWVLKNVELAISNHVRFDEDIVTRNNWVVVAVLDLLLGSLLDILLGFAFDLGRDSLLGENSRQQWLNHGGERLR